MKEIIKAYGEVMMRLEVPNYLKLEQSHSLNVTYTGTSVNVLSALSKYGHHTSLITKLPENSLGDAAIASIRSRGVSTSDIVRGGEYLGMYFLENGYSVRPTKVTYSNREASSFCSASLSDFDLTTILQDTKIIHFCGIALAISEQTRMNALQIAKMAKEQGITIVFDCNYRPKLWKNQKTNPKKVYEKMLHLSDICFMTEKDALYVLGMETKEIDQQKQIEDVLPMVAKKYQLSTIAGTIRKNEHSENKIIKGFLYYDNDFIYSKEYVYKVVDRIGAGDGFTSGVMHGLLNQLSLKDTIEFATASGVLAHTTHGDVPVCSLEEVWNLVNEKFETNLER
ncbi:sugar kinase [Pseudogracilibacillus sp. SE30717A]|uniref:sugar kinase n=1 Tax=Pseudogracilibacillus sp. SE30717A TaxID=3098293 RepID=UPI00300E15AB